MTRWRRRTGLPTLKIFFFSNFKIRSPNLSVANPVWLASSRLSTSFPASFFRMKRWSLTSNVTPTPLKFKKELCRERPKGPLYYLSGNCMALLAVSKRALQGPRSKKRALQYWERETLHHGKGILSQYYAIPFGVPNKKFAAEAFDYFSSLITPCSVQRTQDYNEYSSSMSLRNFCEFIPDYMASGHYLFLVTQIQAFKFCRPTITGGRSEQDEEKEKERDAVGMETGEVKKVK